MCTCNDDDHHPGWYLLLNARLVAFRARRVLWCSLAEKLNLYNRRRFSGNLRFA